MCVVPKEPCRQQRSSCPWKRSSWWKAEFKRGEVDLASSLADNICGVRSPGKMLCSILPPVHIRIAPVSRSKNSYWNLWEACTVWASCEFSLLLLICFLFFYSFSNRSKPDQMWRVVKKSYKLARQAFLSENYLRQRCLWYPFFLFT